MAERVLDNFPDSSVFTRILEIAGEAIITVDENYRILLFNKMAERVFGYPAAEIVGQPLNLLLPQRFREMHQDHMDGFSQSDIPSRLMENRQEVFGLRKNRQEFPATVSFSKVRNNNQLIFTVIIRDITSRRKIEHELIEHQKRLEALIEVRTNELNNVLSEMKKLNENLTREIAEREDAQQGYQNQISLLDGLLNATRETVEIFDANTMEYIKWNNTFNEVTGYTDDEIAAMNPLTDFISDGDMAKAEAAYERLLNEGQTMVVLNQVNKDGRRIPLEYTGAVTYSDEGSPKEVIVIGRDVTERMEADKTRRASQQLIQSSLDALSAHIAILDSSGTILAVNASWRQFADQNGLAWDTYGVGQNYLMITEMAVGEQSQGARETILGIREVLSGQRDVFILEYPCHSPDEKRWFELRVTDFDSIEGSRIVISHENTTRRKQAELSLQQSIEVEATSVERQRLARELHDSVTQTLYSIDLFSDATQQAISAGKTATAEENAKEVRILSQSALADMRLLIFELQPLELEKDGLVASLRKRLELVEERTGIKTIFEVIAERSLPTAVEYELYAIAIEALNNTLKHAQAEQANILLEYNEQNTRLTISDNGNGFDPKSAQTSYGFGLTNMRERIANLGGSMQLNSSSGEGTTVIFEVDA